MPYSNLQSCSLFIFNAKIPSNSDKTAALPIAFCSSQYFQTLIYFFFFFILFCGFKGSLQDLVSDSCHTESQECQLVPQH